ncbi:DUF1667 domain-containing protein [Clostridium sp.]|uniref:DUF1667 domain-containing protein n=1 Tax=Clostridium sp. TaxID=1506 RepID=UPI002A91231C|nr:DUF1667 domain-containing protein [Clostridium sp.]MDY6012239.1 DUF1667 domain-containing protein [Clostridium sp.]
MNDMNLVCLACDHSCNLTINIDNSKIVSVSGNKCKNGIYYAKKECIVPSRVITTVICVDNGTSKTVPVKSEIDVPKSLICNILKELKDLRVNAPINTGDIIKENICNTGINIIATKSVEVSS